MGIEVSSGIFWRRSGHIPVLIILQFLFIILFAKFVIYNPENAKKSKYFEVANKAVELVTETYPMFQDVHVMIFIGFGFLMTFLKKYGLSAVSLNMLCAVISLQWSILVIGFFHLHTYRTIERPDGSLFNVTYTAPGVIYLDLTNSMLYSDFASAAVLISFGVLLGKTSPLQLIVMTLIEIFLFVLNEVIGRQYLNAVDAGDTIFVHMFGAYFGLGVSRILYNRGICDHTNEGSAYNSDLFSMVGTVFLWLFWPSFNSAAALPGDAQHRAILNTYLSLCASVVSSFAFSALTNHNKKFVMEHIQNATLAGGVAIGACADLMVQPYGALLVGTVAGILSTCGFEYISPYLRRKFKIHDTCGVNNLHGMPGVLGTLLSVFMAAIATREEYKSGLTEIYPARSDVNFSAKHQAMNQFLAGIITLIIALVGGIVTGVILKWVAKWQQLDAPYKQGSTVVKLALNVGNVTAGSMGVKSGLPKEAVFNDNLFFEISHDDNST